MVNLSTNGIEIHSEKHKNEEEFPYQLDIWDFGGQEIFYPTHQFFLSDKAIYLVVFRCDKLEESRIEYWLKTIRWLTNNNHSSLVFLIGTYSDCVTEDSLVYIENLLTTKYTKEFYRFLQAKIFFVNKDGDSIFQLFKSITDTITNTNFLPISVPSSWITLHHYIKNSFVSHFFSFIFKQLIKINYCYQK